MQDKLTQKIHEIAEVLKRHVVNEKHMGLLGGKIGITLFFVHYAKFTKSSKDMNFSYKLIRSLVGDYYHGPRSICYSTGIAGLGWFLEYLRVIDFIEVDTKEIMGDFDDLLCAEMTRQVTSYNYDPLHGALGISYYLMCRKDSVIIDKALRFVIDKLEEIATQNGEKMLWLSFDSKMNSTKPGEYNLGLAHGNPGILSMLCSLYSKKPFLRERLTPIIEKSTNFILWCFDNRPIDLNYTSSFSFSYKENESFYNSRLGWCYGDLGVALSLRLANKILDNERINSVILQVLSISAQRKSISEAMLFDAALCHGTSGVAHIYNSFYKEFRLPFLKDVADYWYLQSLHQSNFSDGPAGYKAYRQGSESISCYGFLEGISGIGLAYIAYLTNDDSWERSLFISH